MALYINFVEQRTVSFSCYAVFYIIMFGVTIICFCVLYVYLDKETRQIEMWLLPVGRSLSEYCGSRTRARILRALTSTVSG